MTKRADVLGIPIIPVNTAAHVKRRKSAVRMDARISLPISAACAQNVHFIAVILKKMSALLRVNLLTFVMAAMSFQDVHF